MATTRRGTGVALALTSGATFGTSGSFATSLLDAGWTPTAAVTARVGIAALVLTPFALTQLRGDWRSLYRQAGLITAFGLVAIAGCQLFYFEAVQRLNVGVALLLEYMGTVLVVGWLWLRHGQRPRRLTVAGGVLALAGLGLVLDLAGSRSLDPIGVLWGLAAAVGLAIFFMLSSRTDVALPALVLAWSSMGIGFVLLVAVGLTGVLPVRAPRADVTLFHHRTSWLVPVLCLAVVAAALAYLAGIGAARLLGPKVSSFFGLTEVLFAVLFAWALLGQVPTMPQLLGGAFIIAGVALVRIDESSAPPVAESTDLAAAPA